MKLGKYLLLLIFCVQSQVLSAKDYDVSYFGIKADGKTLNTKSIQFAIDYITENGGGRLVFGVGKYLTGSIFLKSNVDLHLEKGAIILGSLNPFDYQKIGFQALVFAVDQQNVRITGSGTIDGQGNQLARNVVEAIEKGLIQDSYSYGRSAEHRPMLVYFRLCKNVEIKNTSFTNSAFWTQTYDQCTNLKIDSININCTSYWNQDGVDIVDCIDVTLTNSFINAADDGICLKSHDPEKQCKNILIQNNLIRSSANGIKFGTASYGGFSNVRILNNIVYDTYRSAIALEAVDGGFIENIVIDHLESKNTGNLIFLRIGERVAGKKGRLENISISNVIGDIPATKADAGYGFEGPVEDLPRNISPAIIIAGLPNALISNVTMKNISLRHAGGAVMEFANVPLNKLNTIPELPKKYPDFSMFKELPAWAIFARNATGLRFSDIRMVVERKDFRMPVVLDNVKKSSFSGLKVLPDSSGKIIFQNNCSEIVVN